MKKVVILSILINLCVLSLAQTPTTPALERKVTINAENQPIESVLADISNQAGFVFSYSPEAIHVRNKTTIHASNKPVKLVLNSMFDDEVNFKTRGKYIILKKNANHQNTEKQVIEGYITDSNSGEMVTEASIYSKDMLVSAVTDQYGYFKMEVPVSKGIPPIYVSKFGYADTMLASKLSMQQKRMLDISLSQQDSATAKRKSKLSFQKIVPSWLIPKKIRIHSLNLNDSIFRSVQFSLLPMVSTNYFLTGNVENNFSFNTTVGYVYGVNKLELGGLVNIVRTNARYCQLAGIGNIVGGNFTGFQGAGILNYAYSAKGVQSSGVLNTSLGKADVQLAGVLNQSFSSTLQASGVVNLSLNTKVQLAGTANIAYSSDVQVSGTINKASVTNTQAAGIVNLATKSSVTQLAGIINLANANSTQVAGIINAAKNSTIAQVSGITNMAFESSSVQVSGICNQTETGSWQISGFLNKARHIKKLQVGLINISDTCTGVPIGLFSYVNSGYHKLEFAYDETSTASLAFRTGSKAFHTIFTGGILTKDLSEDFWTFGLGLGTSIGNMDKTLFDIDATVNHIVPTENNSLNARLYRVYLGIDRRLFYKLSVSAGLTFNLLTCDSKSSYFTDGYAKIPPYSISNQTNTNGTNVKTWIGGKIAFRLF